MEQVFIKDGLLVTLTKDEIEPLEKFVERGYFVVSQKPDSKNLDKIETLSKVHSNMIHEDCSYSKNLMRTVQQMAKKV